MVTNHKHNERIANMTFSSVFPHYVAKIEKKGRSIEELYQVIQWLTGFDKNEINQAISDKLTFKAFFECSTLTSTRRLKRTGETVIQSRTASTMFSAFTKASSWLSSRSVITDSIKERLNKFLYWV